MITKTKQRKAEETDVPIFIRNVHLDPSSSIMDLQIHALNGYKPVDGIDYVDADIFQWYLIETAEDRERLKLAYPSIRKFSIPDKVCIVRSTMWPETMAYVSTMRSCMEYSQKLINAYF